MPTAPEHKFIFRLPVSLFERLRSHATREDRSINRQILHFLERGLQQDLEAASAAAAASYLPDATS